MIIFIFSQNLSVYNKGELIVNFKCESVQLKDKKINGLDSLMIQADQMLCSEDCVCKIKQMRDFEMKVDQVTLNQWNVNNLHGVINSQSCEIKEITDFLLAKGKILEKDLFFYLEKDRKESFDYVKFSDFWGYVEENFECSGFCVNSYLEPLKNWVNQYYFYSSIIFFLLFFPFISSFSLQITLILCGRERPYQKASQVNYTDRYENSLQMSDLFSS